MFLKTVLSQQFNASFMNLMDGNITELSPKTIWRLKKINKRLESEVKNFNDARTAILTEYCKKDSNGQPLLQNNQFQFETEEKKSECFKKIEGFADIEIEMPIKLEFAEVEKLKLTMKDLVILEDIIDDPKEI